MLQDNNNDFVNVYYLCFQDEPDNPLYFGHTVSSLGEKLNSHLKMSNHSALSLYLRELVRNGYSIDIQQYKTINTVDNADEFVKECVIRGKAAGMVLLNELIPAYT